MILISTLKDLKLGEVALLRVDPNTGAPVNEVGDWVKAGEEQYIKFSSEAVAREYAQSELNKNPLLEWSMVDLNGEQIDTLHNREAVVEAGKLAKKPGFFSRWFKGS